MPRTLPSRLLLATLLCGALALQPPITAIAAPAHTQVYWLRVDPLTPSTLYIGISGALLERSTDGGLTWQQFSDGTVQGQYAQQCGDAADTPIIAADSGDLYTTYKESTDQVCRSGTSGLERFPHNGSGWTSVQENAFVGLASPVRTRRLYAILTTPSGDYLNPAPCSAVVSYRDQGQTSWRTRGTLHFDSSHPNTLSSDTFCPDLVDDPGNPALLYANTAPPARSEDSGLTWQAITLPTTPAVRDFALRPGPAGSDLLMGITNDPGTPNNRRFFSSDHGRTWVAGTCPGALATACPSFVLQNVFGAGSNYAVYPSGIYPFQGTAPAGTPLSPSAGRPFSLKDIAAMQGGIHAGDPVYALLHSGQLYRGADAGKTWTLTGAGQSPTVKPTTPPPGSLRAGPYGHFVGAAFISMYRHLGLLISGFPIDEPYTVAGVRTQDFEHMRLELHGTKVVVGNLGNDDALTIDCSANADPDPNGACANGLVVNGIYPGSSEGPAPQTHAADFARFVRQHGGAAIFGTSISNVYQAYNNDHSNRLYDMQLFTHVRLEWHPEIKNPKYRILLGLIGPEVLSLRGWQ